MTQQADPAGPSGEPTRTGVADVDDVIRDVEASDERAPEELVEVFESAHARLRRALDDPAD